MSSTEPPYNTQGEVIHSITKGPNFVLISNTGAVAETACVFQNLARQELFKAVEELRQAEEIDPQIAIVLTTEPLACGDLFYVALANDIRGIGYQHQDPREVFDDSPESRLEGIAFLNDWPYWERNSEEFAKAFNHEIGHRWAARVHAQRDGSDSAVLLGRQELHWSYFLDTNGSPLEGNDWFLVDDQSFRANTPFALRTFSNLDLYLMGVLPPDRVGPFSLLVTSGHATDCLNAQLSAASPPQSCGAIDLPGRLEPLGLGDVLKVEGPRNPPFDTFPRAVDTAVVVLESGPNSLDSSQCERLSTALRNRFSDFERATNGRLVLRNATTFDTTCMQAFSAAATRKPTTAASCQLAASQPRGAALLDVALLALASIGWLRCFKG